MPTFEYVALGLDGKKASGVVTADNARAARKELRFRSLTPLSLKEANEKSVEGRQRQKISASDRVIVTRQLAMMVGSGIQIELALGAVSSQAEKPAMRRLFAGMRDKVAEGYKFSETVAEHPKIFPPLYASIALAGEISGDLPRVLERLADHLETSHRTRRKVQTALIYPAVLGFVAVLVIGLLMAFVVPRMVEQFSNFDQQLPLLTRIVIGVSSGLQSYGLIMLLVLVLGMFGWRRLLARPTVKRRFDSFLLKLPVIGRLVQTVNAARFARTFGMLTGGGTPVLESLTAACGSLNNLVFVDAINEAIDAVREGVTPARALAKTDVFPPMLTSLTASSTGSNNLAELMDKAAGYLEEEFDRSVALVLGLLEPLIILILGTLVALIVLSIMLPIMQLNGLAFS
jgi:general secretion pathway protein F